MIGMREIVVQIAAGLDADGIKDALNETDELGEANPQLFEVAHALLANHKDDRAEVFEVGVEDVTIDHEHPSQVHLELTISWSAHYGCKDMDRSDEECVSETATYTADGTLIFVVPAPRRPVSDC
jgi:hypothetical protein